MPCAFLALPGHDDGYEWDEPGLYPDVLRPVPNGEAPVRFGSWGAVWFDLTTTDPVRAGVHELAIVMVSPDGSELHREPVTVEITGIELPPLDIVSSHWMHLDALADHYGVEVFSEEHWTLVERFIAAAAEMGVTSLLAPVWTPPLDTAVGSYRTVVQLIDITATTDGYRFGFDRLRRWLDLCRRNGITGVEVAHLFTQWGAEATPGIVVNQERAFGWDVPATDARYRTLMEALLPALQAVLDEEWDREHVVFHISDEPSGEGGLASYLAAKAVVADLLKGWTVVDALSEHSFYTSGAVPVPVVATDHVEPFLAERPERLWVYYCVSQDRDVANRFIGMPSSRNRAIGHQLFSSGVDGFLHWGFNFWYSWHSIRRVDPFTDTSAGGAFPSGDPFAVYPGPGQNTLAVDPLPRLRAGNVGPPRTTSRTRGPRNHRGPGPHRPRPHPPLQPPRPRPKPLLPSPPTHNRSTDQHGALATAGGRSDEAGIRWSRGAASSGHPRALLVRKGARLMGSPLRGLG